LIVLLIRAMAIWFQFVTSYPTEAAARSAITRRSIDAALVPGPAAQHLLVATAVSPAETNAIIKVFSAGAATAHVPLTATNIRPLHPGDPDGLSQVFFVVALLAPSLAFGNQLISRIGPRLNELWHLAMIAVYAIIIAAVATAIADALIGALTGATWAIFGIGALLAFASAVMSAAATRWVGGIGYLVVLLLFVPVGISSSGTTLGPHMITPWYADLGKALPPGSAQPAIRNVTYFNGNAIIDPLLVLSAWALAGVIALVLAANLHPPVRQPGQSPAPSRQASVAPQTPAAARAV
jgi:MFS family permease